MRAYVVNTPLPSRIMGLDLTNGPARANTAALLQWGGVGAATLLALVDRRTDADLLALAAEWDPLLIAIDAPLSLPLGLDCLDPAHPCIPAQPGSGRAAERALSREGIASYYTTKHSPIKPMIARALDLTATWEEAGRRVIEIYPYGSKVRLWGRDPPHKATWAGRTLVQTRLAALVGGLADPAVHLYTHDELDAILAAHTGGLVLAAQADPVGDPTEGVIWVPRVGVGVRG